VSDADDERTDGENFSDSKRRLVMERTFVSRQLVYVAKPGVSLLSRGLLLYDAFLFLKSGRRGLLFLLFLL
jgi:hypothetical protein